MENRVLFRGIRKNGYHGTKPCTFWQKSILRGKSETHGTKGYILLSVNNKKDSSVCGNHCGNYCISQGSVITGLNDIIAVEQKTKRINFCALCCHFCYIKVAAEKDIHKSVTVYMKQSRSRYNYFYPLSFCNLKFDKAYIKPFRIRKYNIAADYTNLGKVFW